MTKLIVYNLTITIETTWCRTRSLGFSPKDCPRFAVCILSRRPCFIQHHHKLAAIHHPAVIETALGLARSFQHAKVGINSTRGPPINTLFTFADPTQFFPDRCDQFFAPNYLTTYVVQNNVDQ